MARRWVDLSHPNAMAASRTREAVMMLTLRREVAPVAVGDGVAEMPAVSEALIGDEVLDVTAASKPPEVPVFVAVDAFGVPEALGVTVSSVLEDVAPGPEPEVEEDMDEVDSGPEVGEDKDEVDGGDGVAE